MKTVIGKISWIYRLVNTIIMYTDCNGRTVRRKDCTKHAFMDYITKEEFQQL